jgi:hypothetical protein
MLQYLLGFYAFGDTRREPAGGAIKPPHQQARALLGGQSVKGKMHGYAALDA